MSSDINTKPQTEAEPETIEDYLREGWSLHVQGEHARAERNFREAFSMEPLSVEASYGLGLSLKLQGQKQEALQVFQRTIDLINSGKMNEHPRRATMLRHLSTWHIRTISSEVHKEPEP